MKKFTSGTSLVLLSTLLFGCNTGSSSLNEAVSHVSSFIQTAINSTKARQVCSKEEMLLADALLDQLSTCDYSRSSGYQPEQQKYFTCINLIKSSFSHLKTDSCKEFFLPTANQILINNLKKDFENVESAEAGLSSAYFQRVFGHLKQWYTAASVLYFSDGSYARYQKVFQLTPDQAFPDKAFTNDLSNALDSFWNQYSQATRTFSAVASLNPKDKGNKKGRTQEAASASSNADLVGKKLFTNGLTTITRLISIATGESLPPRVLAVIMGQSLAHIHKRAQFFSELSDHSCELRSCGIRKESPIFNFLTALSGLDDGNWETLNQMPSEVQASYRTFLVTDRRTSDDRGTAEIAEFLTTLFQSASWKIALFNELRPSDSKLAKFSDLQPNEIPEYARQYISIVSAIRNQLDSYGTTGFYFGGQKNSISMGFGEKQVNGIIERIGPELAKLDASINHLDQSVQKQLDLAHKQQQNKLHREQLESEKEEELYHLFILNRNMEIAQSQIAQEDQRVATYMQSAQQLFQSPEWKTGYSTRKAIRFEGTQQISGSDAKFDPRRESFIYSNINEIAVKTKEPISIAPYETLTLNVSGKWSPNCALQRFISGNSLYQHINATSTQIGSDGFVINGVGSSAHVDSIDESSAFEKVHSESDHKYVRGNVRTWIEGSTPGRGILGISMGVTISGDVGIERNWVDDDRQMRRRGESKRDDSERRTQAAFDMGLRLPYTPFPQFPAGSLLLVQIPQGKTNLSTALDVQVVRARTVVTAKENSNYYFIVNDCQSGDRTPLTVEYTVQQSMDGRAGLLFQRMVDAVKGIQLEGEKYIRVGHLTAIQTDQLRKNAMAKIASAGLDPREVPVLHDLFENWIASELHQLEQKANIIQIAIQMEPRLIQLKKINTTLENLETEEELNGLSQIWMMSNLDINKVGAEILDSMRFLRQRLNPLIKLRYPYVLSDSRVGTQHVALLNSISMASSITEVARNLRDFYGALSEGFQLEHSGAGFADGYIVVSFPRTNGTSQQKVAPSYGSPYPYVPFLSAYQPWKAFQTSLENRPESVAAWGQFKRDSVGYFEVRPEDAYVMNRVAYTSKGKIIQFAGFDQGALDCQAMSPIVQSMGLYFEVSQSLGNNTIAALHRPVRSVGAKLVSESTFPQVQEPVRLQISSDWGTSSIPVFFGTEQDPITQFETLGLHNRKGIGEGISPFGRFEINMMDLNFTSANHQKIIPHISDMRLVFKVSYRKATSPLEWLPRCQDAIAERPKELTTNASTTSPLTQDQAQTQKFAPQEPNPGNPPIAPPAIRFLTPMASLNPNARVFNPPAGKLAPGNIAPLPAAYLPAPAAAATIGTPAVGQNQDPSQSAHLIGQKNLGNTCFANATHRLLMNHPSLPGGLIHRLALTYQKGVSGAVYKLMDAINSVRRGYVPAITRQSSRLFSDELNSLFDEIEQDMVSRNSQTSDSGDYFSKNKQTGEKSYIRRDQIDAHEYLLYLLNHLKANGLPEKDFFYEGSSIQDQSGQIRLESPKPLLTLNLNVPIKSASNVQWLLNQSLNPETVSGAFNPKTKVRELLRKESRFYGTAEVNHIIVRLGREIHDAPQGGTRKNTNSVQISKRLAIPYYPLETSNGQALPQRTAVFYPTTIIVHEGDTPQSGHYVAYARDGKLRSWVYHDDSIAQLLSEDEFNSRLPEIEKNAYLIMYKAPAPKPN